MTIDSAPWRQIRELAARDATGEFICATSAIELHLYLQRGRVAWATSSTHPLEFSRFIKERGRIDNDTFRQVVDECRREKLPLGETLVAWKLVTWDDVKAAVLHQVTTAAKQLIGASEAQTMFLQRERFTEYNPELTLDLSDLERVLDDTPAAGDVASAVLHAAASVDATGSQQPPTPEDVSVAERFLGSVADVRWVAVFAGTRRQIALPEGEVAVPGGLLTALAQDQSDFVALRSSRGTLIGASLSERTSLWCRLESDARYNAAISALFSLNVVPIGTARSGPRVAGRSAIVTRGQDNRALEALKATVELGNEVLSAVVLTPDGRVSAAVGRSEVDMETCAVLAHKRARLFATPGDVLDAGNQARTVVTRERAWWCFGSELRSSPGTTLWVLTQRGALQGLGWACLTTLVRRLEQVERLNEVGVA